MFRPLFWHDDFRPVCRAFEDLIDDANDGDGWPVEPHDCGVCPGPFEPLPVSTADVLDNPDLLPF